MEERYIAAVDLGTSKIAVGVARIIDEDIQIIYYKETPSDGIRYSYVFNPQKATAPVKQALEEAQKALGIKILQAVVGLPRFYVKQQKAAREIPRNDVNSCISMEEVENVKNMALDDYPLANPEKEMIYGAVAQSFTTDDIHQGVVDDVVGSISDRLEGNFKVFIGNRKSVANMDRVFNDAGIAIVKSYFTPDVTARAILTEEEIHSGVALIDMGAGVTSVSVYLHGILRHYASIPFGGSTITNDIKLEGGFSTSLAENIKLAYGACMPDKLASMTEKIIKIQYPENDSEKQLPVRYLSEIITARANEIINAILYEIEMSGCADELRSGVVLTGGGAELVNISNYLKDLSGYNVRTGYPLRRFSASGCPGVGEATASTCIGMILSAKGDKYINCIDTTMPNEGRLDILMAQTDEETVAEKAKEQENVAEEVQEAEPQTENGLPEQPDAPTTPTVSASKRRRKPEQTQAEEGSLFGEDDLQDVISRTEGDDVSEKPSGKGKGGLWKLFTDIYEGMK